MKKLIGSLFLCLCLSACDSGGELSAQDLCLFAADYLIPVRVAECLVDADVLCELMNCDLAPVDCTRVLMSDMVQAYLERHPECLPRH